MEIANEGPSTVPAEKIESPEAVQNKRNLSTEQSISKRSSMAGGTRQPSEDSRNIRFVDRDIVLPPQSAQPYSGLVPPHPDADSRRGSYDNWRSFARRFTVNPELLKKHGLTKIRVGGHLNWKEIVHRFERQSTFHGISHAALAPNKRYRWFWHVAFFICLACLLIQIYLLSMRYFAYEKTVDLDLKFKNAPFPSITLCNLNPYKRSAILANPATKAMIDAYTRRIGSGDKAEGLAAGLARGLSNRVRREKRKVSRRKSKSRYLQAMAQCLCDMDPLTGERRGSCFGAYQGKIAVQLNESVRTFGNLQPSRCLCQLDMVSKTLWPCFPYSSWKEKLCSECVDGSGHCPMRFYKGNEQYEEIKDQVDLCLCHREYNHCVASREDGVIIEIDPNDELGSLNINQRAESQRALRQEEMRTTTTTEAPEVVKALGLEEEDVQGDISIASRAQQNLMLTVGGMTLKEKAKMSYSLDEFILQCTFNQKDCDMKRDFKQHYDNTYGNCYTFNHNRTAEVTSHRAGATYGLRVLLYADISEYLPTSGSVGFRISVHDKHVVPFPDAFGYSAPTGFMSSFGVRMKQFIRLQPPWGQCEHGGEDSEHFIYEGFNYSVEACHRSCAQRYIVKKCRCADPLYPIPKLDSEGNRIEACNVTDNTQRECLKNTTLEIGEIYAKHDDGIPDCHCHQPCNETNYEVTYSCARWPSGTMKVINCTPGDYMCFEKYRKNAAMVQIFYEELNYETLSEGPAYTKTSLIADIGGMTGLWIGASVISLLELVTLVIFATQAYVRQKKEERAAAQGSQPQLLLPNKSNSSKSTLASTRKTSNSSKNSKNRLSIQDVRSLKSNHSSKSRSKQSIFVEDLPSPIQEQSDDESSSGTNASCRYLAPGEELPCLCKYDEMGFIRVMKALCPVHGYMVRRQYDYSVSNSDESNEGEADADVDETLREEPYYDPPFERKSTRRRKGRKGRRSGDEENEEEGESSGLITAEQPPATNSESPKAMSRESIQSVNEELP